MGGKTNKPPKTRDLPVKPIRHVNAQLLRAKQKFLCGDVGASTCSAQHKMTEKEERTAFALQR